MAQTWGYANADEWLGTDKDETIENVRYDEHTMLVNPGLVYDPERAAKVKENDRNAIKKLVEMKMTKLKDQLERDQDNDENNEKDSEKIKEFVNSVREKLNNHIEKVKNVEDAQDSIYNTSKPVRTKTYKEKHLQFLQDKNLMNEFKTYCELNMFKKFVKDYDLYDEWNQYEPNRKSIFRTIKNRIWSCIFA